MGYNWGKVNVLNLDNTFEFEKTYISQSTFDLKTDKIYKGGFCIGLNLDIRIITNLFTTSAATGR
jgi:hypothetical protein